MMASPATGRKDLVLLLRPLDEKSMERLEKWRNNQGEQTVMILSEYVKQYAAEFTGIGQPMKAANDSGKEIEQKVDNPPQKTKKERRKRNRSSKQAKSEVETPAIDNDVEVSEDTAESGLEEDDGVEVEEKDLSDDVGIEGS
jgi:hypothetical protein